MLPVKIFDYWHSAGTFTPKKNRRKSRMAFLLGKRQERTLAGWSVPTFVFSWRDGKATTIPWIALEN
jgi:hypothetical protein